MSFISNNEIQAAIVSKLKSLTAVTSQLNDANEIREDQWMGTEFSYPNIRVRMISNEPMQFDSCYQNFEVTIIVFSELYSSLEADTIAGIINNELHSKTFSENNLAISLTTRNLVPAISAGDNVWRAELIMTGLVSG